MGFVFPEKIRLEIYVIGLILILCAIVILLASNLLIKEREYFKQIEKVQAGHDAITGLPKHQLFLERTKVINQQESDIPVVLVILISGLRQLDRRMGFGMSDYVLRTIAQRTHAALRSTDYVARLSENLFAVYMEDLKERESVQTICNNILQSIRVPIQVEGEQTPIYPYIGVAFYQDHSFDDVLNYAQAAALEACDRGMEIIYAQDIKVIEHTDHDLVGILQTSLSDKTFELFYQPQVDIRNLRVVGAEALIRLPSEKWISIGVGELVELAERNGMIHQLDMLVFELLFEQLKEWIPSNLNFRISVNMSAKSFKNRALVAYIQDQLNENPKLGDALKIEITETANLENAKEVMDIMKELAAKNVIFCIDDFGTQYASMEYMQRLPFNEVKIDKSFVLSALNDKTSEKIVRSVISLAHDLNLSVTAEGVESEDMLNYLRALNCDKAQGYYFSHALSASEFLGYFKRA
ncbi:MAG: bifunctional diguanylate cyclase/phosphodiesterase [Pseudomonadota bacterium]